MRGLNLKNDFKIEKYLTIYKILGLQFIISNKYAF